MEGIAAFFRYIYSIWTEYTKHLPASTVMKSSNIFIDFRLDHRPKIVYIMIQNILYTKTNANIVKLVERQWWNTKRQNARTLYHFPQIYKTVGMCITKLGGPPIQSYCVFVYTLLDLNMYILYSIYLSSLSMFHFHSPAPNQHTSSPPKMFCPTLV